MTSLEYAREYIKRGWSIIPLEPGTKRPPAGFTLGPYLSGGFRILETDNLSYWWGAHGIGIITGRPSGLVVADVDPRNGGVEPDERGPRVRTGGGGIHIYFSLPDHLPEPRCGPSSRPGIDRKAGGGYVVAPPSIHPNGQPYVWINYV